MLIQEAIDCLNLAIELGLETIQDLEDYMEKYKISKDELLVNLTCDNIAKTLKD